MRITWDMTRRLADEWQKAVDQPGLLSRTAEAWGVHVSTLRRRLAEDHGLRVGAVEAESVTRASYVPDEDVRTVAVYIARSIRKGHTDLGIRDAIEVAWREGALKSPHMPTVSTMSRRMRELGVNPEQLVAPTPHRTMKSEHANHVHQLDASLCIQYRFTRSGLGLRYVDMNKLEQVKDVVQAVHRWVLADHLSGAFVVKYFDSPGERVEDMIRFLHWAWSHKQDLRIPVCGVPRILYCDRGSAFLSHALQNLCKAYDIDLRWHAPGVARATGSAESTHWVFERAFEAKLRLQHISTVAELVERAELEALAVNRTRLHSRHNRTRFDAWEASVPRPVRVPVESLEQFSWLAHGRQEERQVSGDGLISYAQKRSAVRWWHVAGALPGQTVVITPHPWEAGIRVTAQDGKVLASTPVTKDEWGFLSTSVPFGTSSTLAPTAAEQIVEAASTLPELKRAFLDSDALPVEDYEALPVPMVSARTAEQVTRRVVELNRFEAKEVVIERLGRPLTREEGLWWNGRIGDVIDEDALEEALTTFLGGDLSTPAKAVSAEAVRPALVRVA